MDCGMFGGFCNSIAWLVLVGAAMGAFERIAPASPSQKFLRSGFVTDLIYWLTPYFLYGPLAPKPLTGLTQTLQAIRPAGLRKIIAKRDKFDAGIRRVLKSGMDAGVFRNGDAKLFSFAILGSVNYIPRWFNPRGPARSDEIAQVFADYLIAGLRASSAEFPNRQ